MMNTIILILIFIVCLKVSIADAMTMGEIKKESFDTAVKICVSQPRNSLVRQLFTNMQKIREADTDFDLVSNCLMAKSLIHKIDLMALHFSFKPTIDEKLIAQLSSMVSRSQLSALADRVERVALSDDITTENLDYIFRKLNKVLDNPEITAEIFANLWQQGQSETSRQQFLDVLEVSYLVAVRLSLGRPDFGTPDSIAQSSFFHLAYGRTGIMDTASEEMLTKGFSSRDHSYSKSYQPDKSALQWGEYTLGFERLALYPEPQSQFIMLNPNPFSYLKPEDRVDERYMEGADEKDKAMMMKFALEKRGHDMFILRYKGHEYVTLEGRPCTATKNRNIYNCELPISFSHPSIAKVLSRVSQ